MQLHEICSDSLFPFLYSEDPKTVEKMLAGLRELGIDVEDETTSRDSLREFKNGTFRKLEFQGFIARVRPSAFELEAKFKEEKAPMVSNGSPILQVEITTSKPLPFAESGMGFLAWMEEDRKMWGGFHTGLLKSRWSVFLNSEEEENNHEVSKRIRKIHQTLTKMAHAASGELEIVQEKIRMAPHSDWTLPKGALLPKKISH